MRHVVRIFICSLLSWLFIACGIALYVMLVKETESPWFVMFHYALDIFTVWIVFDQYFRRFEHYPAFATMLIALISVNLIEFVFWNVFYKGPMQMINFTHYAVPMILITVTIFLVGRQYRRRK